MKTYSQVSSQPQNLGKTRNKKEYIRGAGYVISTPPIQYSYISSIPRSETTYDKNYPNKCIYITAPTETTLTKKTTLL